MGLLDGGLQAIFGAALGPLYLNGTLRRSIQTYALDGSLSQTYTTHPIKVQIDALTEQMRSAPGTTEQTIRLLILQSGVDVSPDSDDQVYIAGRGIWLIDMVDGDAAQTYWQARGTPQTTVTQGIDGTLTGTGGGTGQLTLTHYLSGSLDGFSGASGSLTIGGAFSGTMRGTGTATGSLTTRASLTGSLSGLAMMTGALNNAAQGLFPARYMVFFVIGQSPAAEQIPIPTDHTPPAVSGTTKGRMLKGGVHIFLKNDADKFSALVPITETMLIVNEGLTSEATYSGGVHTGIVEGFFDQAQRDGETPETLGVIPIVVKVAVTGQPIKARPEYSAKPGLSKGSPSYTNAMAAADAIISLAAAEGADVFFAGASYEQGAENNDYSANPDATSTFVGTEFGLYYDALVQLRQDYDTDLKAKIAAANTAHGWSVVQPDLKFRLIIDNSKAYRGPGGTTNAGNTWVARAQLAVALAHPNHFSAPAFEGNSFSGVHPPPIASYRTGLHIGRALYRDMVLDSDFTAVYVDSVVAYDHTYRYHVVVPDGWQLAKFLGNPTQQPFDGFRIETDAGTNKPLLAGAYPSLKGGVYVDVTTAATTPAATATDVARYGSANQGGNIWAVPASDQLPLDPLIGVTYGYLPINPSQVTVTLSATPLPTLSATPLPPALPAPPPPPPANIYPPYTILEAGPASLAWMMMADDLAGTNADGDAIQNLTDVFGHVMTQPTLANRAFYSGTSYNGTPGLTFDGVNDSYRQTPVPTSIPSGNGFRQIWFTGDFLADADTTRHAIAAGGSSGAYLGIRVVLVSGIPRFRVTDNTTPNSATDLTVVATGRHTIKGWNGPRADGVDPTINYLWIQVDGNTPTRSASPVTLATGTTALQLAGSPSLAANDFWGVFKGAWIVAGQPTSAQDSALWAYAATIR